MDDIAVIIVNYNGLQDSIACIMSILNSDVVDSINIILVDNASHVDEAKIIRTMFPSIITIQSEFNNGFAAGNNLGIQYALRNGYKYIALINNDTIVAPNMLRLLRSYCTEECITAPKIYYFAKDNKIWYNGGFINRRTGNAKHYFGNNTGVITFASGCCMMIRDDVFKKVGFLDESFFMYFEDAEFCIRLANAGIKIKYVPLAVMWHKVASSSGGSFSPFAIYYTTRNRLNCVKKYNKFFCFTAYPFSLISRIIRMITASSSRIRHAYYKAIVDHFKGIAGKVDDAV